MDDSSQNQDSPSKFIAHSKNASSSGNEYGHASFPSFDSTTATFDHSQYADTNTNNTIQETITSIPDDILVADEDLYTFEPKHKDNKDKKNNQHHVAMRRIMSDTYEGTPVYGGTPIKVEIVPLPNRLELMAVHTNEDDDKPKYHQQRFMGSWIKYSHLEIILSFVIIIIGLCAFIVPIYRCIVRGEWTSNPFDDTTETIPYFDIISIHVIIALLFSFLLPFQLISGIYIRQFKANIHTNQNIKLLNKYKKSSKFHKVFGSKLVSILLIILLILAMISIGLRWNILEFSFLSVNIFAGIVTVFYFVLGMYYIFSEQKDIERHRDCMMLTVLFVFYPAIYRLTVYFFYFTHWIMYGEISTFHPNNHLVVVSCTLFVCSVIIPLQYHSLRNWYNMVIFIVSILYMVIFSLIESDI